MTENDTKTQYTGRIADLKADERPREKALRDIRALSDTELIALLLGGGVQGKSVIDLSREMLAKADNSLSVLSRMPVRQMCRMFKGVGPAKAVTLAAAFELGGRCRDESARENAFVQSSKDAYDYLRCNLERLEREEFWILILSRSNRITGAECVSRGGTAGTIVDIKLLIKIAVDNLASGIIAVHNHPSGNLHPSVEDDRITNKIKEAAKLLDIRLLDHIIVGGDSYYSYNDHGRL